MAHERVGEQLILELYADERALRGPDCRGDQDDGSGDASAVQWPARPGIGHEQRANHTGRRQEQQDKARIITDEPPPNQPEW